ncbi:uncharacterized protein B0I36DRAFT_362438 [Microdochium trichocladiopsis]|uniref:Protein kinase domain-containing protein n=1 Tax=Microdochium trichocladiopsis TaxID=1682393 RepID=A0A9P9BQ80_9PEZI|nr:uncharacterized protein B0I36DRAFT_362438 [Microdochium trichocladiopsis]KAH7030605.1 hypothetical protein B0I36DRAFT_362438 [Microdochium trichocladiopsis]
MAERRAYTVGWICATFVECLAARILLDREFEGTEDISASDSNSYIFGQIGQHNVVIATSSASTDRDSSSSIRMGLLVGIGGGVPSSTHDIRLGDVVTGKARKGSPGLIQYDFGKLTQTRLKKVGMMNQAPSVLLNAEAPNPSRHDVLGHTPLHLAAYCGLSEELNALLSDDKLSLNETNKYGRTSLWYASAQGHSLTIEAILSFNPSIDLPTTANETPLTVATAGGHQEVVDKLLRAKAYLNWQEKGGRTALHQAARNGPQGVITLLLDKRANIDAVDITGSTPLPEATRGGHHAAQETVAGRGANINMEDSAGQTPTTLAWSSKQRKWSGYVVDEHLVIQQGTQATCEVLRCTTGADPGELVLRKTFNWSTSRGNQVDKVRRYLLNEHRIFQKLIPPFIVAYLGYEERISRLEAALDDEQEGGPDCVPLALGEDQVWSIIFQVAAAIAYLHHGLAIKRGKFELEKYWEPVIHRDIKPANNPKGQLIVKLCDLGLAKAILSGQRNTRKIGTPDLSLPEVNGGRGWSMKGDIYLFDVTIDELYKHTEPQAELLDLLDRSLAYSWRDSFNMEPLTERSWVVQERLLARRTIYFGTQQIYWECHRLAATETFPETRINPKKRPAREKWMYPPQVPEHWPTASWKLLFCVQPLMVPRTHYGVEYNPYTSLYDNWHTIVETYAPKKLTYPSDKLVAISGLAKEIRARLCKVIPRPHRYLAGHWDYNFMESLSWLADEGPTRPAVYRAPS